MDSKNKLLALAIVSGTLAGAITAYVVVDRHFRDEKALIKDFYETENAVHVSPHSLRKAMDEGDSGFILVDLRSREEYEREHISGAVNIPAYRDKDHSAYDQVDRIVSSFQNLPKGKDIIVYCYSMPCMTGRKIGKMLAEHGIYVKQLGIGWNEWRHYWSLWNHEHEWNTTLVGDYIARGGEPGTPKLKEASNVCPAEGEFIC